MNLREVILIPRNKYPEETRRKVLEAAVKTFQEKGYEQSTILDIVANMDGLTRGAFYHHFKSKEEVLIAINDIIFEATNPFERIQHEKGLNGLQKLQKVIKMNIADIEDEYKFIRLASMSLLNSPQFLVEQLHFNTLASRKYIQPLIEEGVADGSIKIKHPQLVAELANLLFGVWFLPLLYPGDIDYMQTKAQFAMELLEHLGLPISDDEFDELGENYINVLHDAYHEEKI